MKLLLNSNNEAGIAHVFGFTDRTTDARHLLGITNEIN